MALLDTTTIDKLDPGTFTGPVRTMSGVGKASNVTLDTRFGEYAIWLYVGVTGNVSYVQWDGTTQALTGLAAGVWHPICCIQVNSSGTTATNIVWGS